jgi:F-type H+-transporting ATPase subunit gamma
MDTLESLSDAIQTTRDIQSIVRTMKALSSVSIRQYEQAEAAIADYARTGELGLMVLLRQRRQASLPWPGEAARGNGRQGLIVIGSDRGLCGRYNDIITRFSKTRLNDRQVVTCIIGARVLTRLEADGHCADSAHSLPGSVEGLTRLVQAVIVDIDRWTHQYGIGQVWVLHNRRKGAISARPQAVCLLPIADSDLHDLSATDWPGRSMPFFRMDPDRLVSWLVQQRIFVMIYRALTEALSSEHASRLAAMQAAERNIEERRGGLHHLYRVRRQEIITRELMDVVAGYEAVSSADGY